MPKLNLDRDQVDDCRELAETIVRPVQRYIEMHSTVSVERSVLRLLGFTGNYEVQEGIHYPVANLIIDKLDKRLLKNGVASLMASLKKRYSRYSQQKIAEKIIKGEVDYSKLEELPSDKAHQVLKNWIDSAYRHVDRMRYKKEEMRQLGGNTKPLKYVALASGDVDEDVRQAKAAALMGADIIAVVRSTGQSLLDYVPEGKTAEGYGGTFATQENMKLLRTVLDDVSKEQRRYIRLSYSSAGLCMPEIAVMAALEGADYVFNDALYGILYRDINIKRAYVDQYFSRVIISRAGMVTHTGEDHYLATHDSYDYQFQVIASQFINEQLAKNSGVRDDLIGLSHSFDMDPNLEDSFIYELAMAQLIREIFPRVPLKYTPPSHYKSCDAYFNQALNAMYHLVGVLTEQNVLHLGGVSLTEHQSLLQERHAALQSANYITHAARTLGDEVQFMTNGKVMRRARTIMGMVHKHLEKIKNIGLFDAIEQGCFVGRERSKDGGCGFEGVFEKSRRYFNPFLPQSNGRGG